MESKTIHFQHFYIRTDCGVELYVDGDYTISVNNDFNGVQYIDLKRARPWESKNDVMVIALIVYHDTVLSTRIQTYNDITLRGMFIYLLEKKTTQRLWAIVMMA